MHRLGTRAAVKISGDLCGLVSRNVMSKPSSSRCITCVVTTYNPANSPKRGTPHRIPRWKSCSAQPLIGSRRAVNTAAAERSTDVDQETTGAEGKYGKHEFQAETRMLLDIVAKSLYSEKEVFIRELISNSSDALEKLRYQQLSSQQQLSGGDASTIDVPSAALDISILCDRLSKTITFQDTGVGMSYDELKSNLGTIARSGSKAFLEELRKQGGQATTDAIIGQFGVGFYSAFMVADKIEVLTKTTTGGSDAVAYRWFSDGSGTYEISEAEEAVQPGTKIILHLKPDCLDFADEANVENIVKKYSNFVSFPIYLNGRKLNELQALWTLDPKDISDEMHDEFYRFIAHNQYDRPQFRLHYKTDAPINVRALLYVPETKPSMFDIAQSGDAGVALYSRKILIQSKANTVVPRWMRFMKGVIDSEDIPLNLSRELLQQTAIISKLKTAVSSRVLRFLKERMKKEPEKYQEFFENFSVFLKEGILSSTDQSEKEDIAGLLIFESSSQAPGVKVSLDDYCGRMQAGQRDIYYLCAPSRELAEASPYYEAVEEKSLEVLFCFEPYDELVLLQLIQYQRKSLTSVEKQVHQDKDSSKKVSSDAEGALSKQETDNLIDWIKATLGRKAWEVKVSNKHFSHPCLLTVEEMGAARHFLRTQYMDLPEEQRYLALKPTMELNVDHPIIRSLSRRYKDDPDLSKLLLEQVYDNALISAGLLSDPRNMVTRLNQLLTRMVEMEEASKDASDVSS